MAEPVHLLDLTPYWGNLVALQNHFGDVSFAFRRFFSRGLVVKAKKDREHVEIRFTRQGALYLPAYLSLTEPDGSEHTLDFNTPTGVSKVDCLRKELRGYFYSVPGKGIFYSKAELDGHIGTMLHNSYVVSGRYESDYTFYGNQVGEKISELEEKIEGAEGDLVLFSVALARAGKYFQLSSILTTYKSEPILPPKKNCQPSKPDKSKTADAMRANDWKNGEYDPSKIFEQELKQTGGKGTLLGI